MMSSKNQQSQKLFTSTQSSRYFNAFWWFKKYNKDKYIFESYSQQIPWCCRSTCIIYTQHVGGETDQKKLGHGQTMKDTVQNEAEKEDDNEQQQDYDE